MSKVIFEDHAIQVIQHREGADGVLIGPPDAGHDHTIVDYAPGKSIIEQALANTSAGVHHINWKGATHARRNETYADKVQQTMIAMNEANTGNLVGLCQAGHLFARVATLYPESVDLLTIAGTPIDTSLDQHLSVMKQALNTQLSYYQWIIFKNNGLMPGTFMLLCWKMSDRKKHYIDRLVRPEEDTEYFYAWFDRTQNLAGRGYLEIVEELFLNNTFKDTLSIHCPVITAVGTRDNITPNAQTWAIEKYCHAGVAHYSCNAGHLGVFIGEESGPMWGNIFTDMNI